MNSANNKVYYQLSKSKYRFKVSAEQSLISLAEKELASSPNNAISILNKTVTLYSKSRFSFNTLANAHGKVKDYDNAIKHQTLAIENSSSLFQRKKDYLRSKLAEYKKHKQG